MFSDRVRVYVAAGRGGDGARAFRREKHTPRGGPSGGDGGRGGDVVLVADPGLRDLTALRFKPHVRAPRGRAGEGALKTGADGADETVPVPVGTQVMDEEGALVADLAHPGARALIARGGRGGRGNARFATSTRQTPRVAEVGEEGEERELVLQLKLLADAALLGFPNVGKSSLLRRISNATPKVADYPFTTIEPVLGTVDGPDGDQLTVVDVPGLLEGASEGIGLGHAFLAHLERARALLHVVDAALDHDAAREGFSVIHRELVQHGHGLAERARIVVLNRIDLVPEEERAERVERFRADIAAGLDPADARIARDELDRPIVVATSCATGEGIGDLVTALFRLAPADAAGGGPVGEDELADFLVFRPGHAADRRVRLLREDGGTLRVLGAGDLESLVEAAARDDRDALVALDAELRARGVLRALARAGAKDGVEVLLGDETFIFMKDEA